MLRDTILVPIHEKRVFSTGAYGNSAQKIQLYEGAKKARNVRMNLSLILSERHQCLRQFMLRRVRVVIHARERATRRHKVRLTPWTSARLPPEYTNMPMTSPKRRETMRMLAVEQSVSVICSCEGGGPVVQRWARRGVDSRRCGFFSEWQNRDCPSDKVGEVEK